MEYNLNKNVFEIILNSGESMKSLMDILIEKVCKSSMLLEDTCDIFDPEAKGGFYLKIQKYGIIIKDKESIPVFERTLYDFVNGKNKALGLIDSVKFTMNTGVKF